MIMVESKRGLPVTDRALAIGWRRRINGAFCKAEFLRYVAALIGCAICSTFFAGRIFFNALWVSCAPTGRFGPPLFAVFPIRFALPAANLLSIGTSIFSVIAGTTLAA